MYLPFFNSIKNIINQGNLGFKVVDWFDGQYDQKYNDDAAEGFPACYIQFMPMQWVEESVGVEHTEATIIFHLVTHQLSDAPNSIMDLAKSFSDHMREKSDMVSPYPLVGPMYKVSTDYIPKGNLKVFKMGFKTVLYDAIPEQYSQDVNGGYELLKD